MPAFEEFNTRGPSDRIVVDGRGRALSLVQSDASLASTALVVSILTFFFSFFDPQVPSSSEFLNL